MKEKIKKWIDNYLIYIIYFGYYGIAILVILVGIICLIGRFVTVINSDYDMVIEGLINEIAAELY